MTSKIAAHVAHPWSRAQKMADYKSTKEVKKMFPNEIISSLVIGQPTLRVCAQTDIKDIVGPTVGSYLLYPMTKRGADGKPDPVSYKEVAAFRLVMDRPFSPYVVLSNSNILGFTNIHLALQAAWYTGCVSTSVSAATFKEHYISSWIDEIVMVPDVEYNTITKCETAVTKASVSPMAVHRIEDEEIDGKLYNIFSQTLNTLLENRDSSIVYSNRMGNTKVNSVCVSPKYCKEIHYHKMKRELTPAQWLQSSTGKVCTIAAQFPKPGKLRSNGQARMVVTPHPTLEAWQRYWCNGLTPSKLAGYVSRPSEIDPSLKYAYDIKSEDEVAGPYFRRWIQDNCPELENKLMPRVIYKGRIYRTKAIPSGVVHTAIIANVFAYSLAKHLGAVKFQFQGDGLLTERPLNSDLLRECEDFTLNGFTNLNGVQFVNTNKLIEPAYVRIKGLTGRHRYAIRYSAYLLLNARGIHEQKYPVPNVLLTQQQIQSYCLKYGASLSTAEKIAFGVIGDNTNEESHAFPNPTAVNEIDDYWE